MSYGTHSFWDIYLFGLHPVCGTVVVVIAFAVFIAGTRDHPERRLFWVTTIFGTLLFGFVVGEWDQSRWWLVFYEDFSGSTHLEGLRRTAAKATRARMMFFAQAGLAVTLGLGLLWWPIRPKEV